MRDITIKNFRCYEEKSIEFRRGVNLLIGAALGNKNVYLVKRGTNCNVLPGSVIFSATAFMNGNVIDLAVPFENKTRILR